MESNYSLSMTVKEKYDTFNTSVKVEDLKELLSNDLLIKDNNIFLNDINGVRNRDIMVGKTLTQIDDISILTIRLLAYYNLKSEKKFKYICIYTLMSLSSRSDHIFRDYPTNTSDLIHLNFGDIESVTRVECLLSLYLMQLLGVPFKVVQNIAGNIGCSDLYTDEYRSNMLKYFSLIEQSLYLSVCDANFSALQLRIKSLKATSRYNYNQLCCNRVGRLYFLSKIPTIKLSYRGTMIDNMTAYTIKIMSENLASLLSSLMRTVLKNVDQNWQTSNDNTNTKLKDMSQI